MKSFAYLILRLFFKIFKSIEVIGLENIPKKGPVIIASNHISNYDPPAILSFIDKIRKDTSVIAKKELFKNPIFSKFLKKMGAIPIDRKRPDITSIKQSIKALNENRCLLIFPQGTRDKNQSNPPKPGISYLVKKTKAPVLPVRIFDVKTNSKLGKIIIVFDKPIDTNKYDLLDKETFDRFPDMIMKTIFSINRE